MKVAKHNSKSLVLTHIRSLPGAHDVTQVPPLRAVTGVVEDDTFRDIIDALVDGNLNWLDPERRSGKSGCFKFSLSFGRKGQISKKKVEICVQIFTIADEAEDKHCRQVQALQRSAHRLLPEVMRDFALRTVGSVDSEEELRKHLHILNDQELRTLCGAAHVDVLAKLGDRALWESALIYRHCKRESSVRAVTTLPLYPTEVDLWDEHRTPSGHYDGRSVLALPKLGLQFLTFSDYLLRNYTLYRLSTTFDIRLDLDDALSRLQRSQQHGWAKMGARLKGGCVVRHVGRPDVGDERPNSVVGELRIDMHGLNDRARDEWSNLRAHDVLFLVHIDYNAPIPTATEDNVVSMKDQLRVTMVRGCAVLDTDDDDDAQENNKRAHNMIHRLKVALDPAQYHLDAHGESASTEGRAKVAKVW